MICATKAIGGKHVLREVNLQVGSGEIVGLLGLNGAGKTSLLKSIVDLIALDSGRIEIAGIDHRRAAAREQVAYLPERFTPFRHLQGAEFLRYMLALDGRRYTASNVGTTLSDLHLDDSVLGARLHTLSKGTGQRLGLAAALLAGKRIYLLDEPTSGLDVVARRQLKRLLCGLKASGCCVLLATHALADAGELCDRLCVIHRGSMCFSGTIEALLQSSASPALEAAFLEVVRRADSISH